MKKNKKIKTIIIIVIILAILLIGSALIYYFIENQDKDIVYNDYTIYERTTGTLEEYDPSITVDGLNAGENAYYIRGKISAKDDKSFSVITYNLYDKDNNLLGTAVAGLNSLEKDKVYDFEAIALLEQNDLTNIDHYELESVELGN